jgi:hypothetical protein
METKQILSEKAKEKLDTKKLIRREDSIFLSIEPEEQLTLEFNPELIEIKEYEFDGKRKRRVVYTVIDKSSMQRKYWIVSQKTSARVDAYLRQAQFVLKVTRKGIGIETTYDFEFP